MKARTVFRIERCPVVTAACAVEGAGGPWALVDPRDGRHAAHARTKLEAREKARLYRRTREEAERADAGAAPAPVVRKGLTPIGGVWWRCVRCGRTVRAECECCEPPACGCGRPEAPAGAGKE